MRILTAIMAMLTSLTVSLGIAQAVTAPTVARDANPPVIQPVRVERIDPAPSPVFRHGDVSWLPSLARQAGWPDHTIDKLTHIVLRESGGCPNRRGGDMVDKNCVITGVSEWNHRSDTGLLQINGVNYNTDRNKWAIACLKMAICTQEPLLDPLVNLRVGYLLYENAGWGPWDPCTWGEKYAHRCKNKKP